VLLSLFLVALTKQCQQKIGAQEKIKAAGGMMKTTQQALEEILQEDCDNYQQELEESIAVDPGLKRMDVSPTVH
jgi:hypothetical protein